jgi:hypothetical protein
MGGEPSSMTRRPARSWSSFGRGRPRALDIEKRIVVLPAQKEKAGTLEFAEYAKLVEDGLRKEGFQVVPSGEPAELVVFFGYGIDQGRDEVYSYAVPEFGQTGVQSS